MENTINIEDINKKVNEYLDKLEDYELEEFFKRSIKDANRLFKQNQNDDINKVAYYIYRAYVVGTISERLRNK